MVFVGYAEQTKAYRMYDKSPRSIVIARDVIFYENEIDETESGSICNYNDFFHLDLTQNTDSQECGVNNQLDGNDGDGSNNGGIINDRDAAREVCVGDGGGSSGSESVDAVSSGSSAENMCNQDSNDNVIGHNEDVPKNNDVSDDYEGGNQGVITTYGSGRQKLLRTGQPGRPNNSYNVLNLVQSDDHSIPMNCAEALSSQNSDF